MSRPAYERESTCLDDIAARVDEPGTRELAAGDAGPMELRISSVLVEVLHGLLHL